MRNRHRWLLRLPPLFFLPFLLFHELFYNVRFRNWRIKLAYFRHRRLCVMQYTGDTRVVESWEVEERIEIYLPRKFVKYDGNDDFEDIEDFFTRASSAIRRWRSNG
jgi:hypothetical protein